MRQKTIGAMAPKKSSLSKAAELKKRKAAKKEKEVQLPALKYGKADQTAPPNQAMSWKPSTLKEVEI